MSDILEHFRKFLALSSLRTLLNQSDSVSFREWIEQAHTKVDVIVTLMAILELYKSKLINMYQDDLYGDISIKARSGFINSFEMDENGNENSAVFH